MIRESAAPPLPRRRHTLHYYLALAGLAAGSVTAVLNLWAYYDERQFSTGIAYAADAVTAGLLFFTFFWGCYLVMSGVIPRRRWRQLTLHAALGCLTPLIYTLIISARLASPGQPVGDLELNLSWLALLVLGVQLASGWWVVRR